ncbi:hypothetical protein PORCRE_997 [Porphyromonas crevioricanis JCM 15906]|uniref:Uncharacterized protein n=1 Tax=Porphyromonas crevioricanis JCM 15906 TaxID=1305617 RepID=T1CNC3_9PORP|nr:hypothetical protein PORCRE_997 [Porphyromonas crevioricanis JCM 15906]
MLAKFLSGEKIDPSRTPYSSAFQEVVTKDKKGFVFTRFRRLFLSYFSGFLHK